MDDARAAQILEKFHEDGGRVTRTRRMVLDVMLSADDHHVTATEIVDGVRRIDPSFPESTVYRTLARLEELGVIAPLASTGATTTYHVADDPHVHVVCDRCGTVVEHDAELLASIASDLYERHGFVLDTHRTVVYGRCRACNVAAPAGDA